MAMMSATMEVVGEREQAAKTTAGTAGRAREDQKRTSVVRVLGAWGYGVDRNDPCFTVVGVVLAASVSSSSETTTGSPDYDVLWSFFCSWLRPRRQSQMEMSSRFLSLYGCCSKSRCLCLVESSTYGSAAEVQGETKLFMDPGRERRGRSRRVAEIPVSRPTSQYGRWQSCCRRPRVTLMVAKELSDAP